MTTEAEMSDDQYSDNGNSNDEMLHTCTLKWGKEIERELAPGCSPQRVWEFLGSFSRLHHWFLSIKACELLEGQDGIPGAIRLCSGNPPGAPSSSPRIWVIEKLLSYNPSELSFSYSMIDGSYGFQNYVSCFSISSSTSPTSSEAPQSAIIKWRFELSPVEGKNCSEVLNFLVAIFDRMILNLEEAILRSANEIEANDPVLEKNDSFE